MAITKPEIEKLLSQKPNEISIIKLVNALITFAYQSRASDIHIDPTEDKVIIRFRIDGVMHEVFSLPKEIHDEVITRIKVLSGLRTDEHQAAQDGRIKFIAEDNTHFDIRVSIVPTYYNEDTVMRLLVEQDKSFDLDTIGFSKRDLKVVKDAIVTPYGMIVASGPTGSGKTTTLYTLLKVLNKPDVSIITIEDPIEYSLAGTNQIQVNNQTGLTFANGLRSILRQDPNTIMVGEIRDEETAKIAVNAALTGHLLLSTIHTNDSATALPRLIDMGVEPFLIVSTVNIVIGQRLVRKICDSCKDKKKYSLSDLELLSSVLPQKLLEKEQTFFLGKGCEKCNGSGYYGRIGIYEVLEITEAIKEAVVMRMGASELKKIALHEGMTTMLEDGFIKVQGGITTVEEILRVIHE